MREIQTKQCTILPIQPLALSLQQTAYFKYLKLTGIAKNLTVLLKVVNKIQYLQDTYSTHALTQSSQHFTTQWMSGDLRGSRLQI